MTWAASRRWASVDNLPRLIDAYNVDLVIITLPWQVQRKILKIIRECEASASKCAPCRICSN